MATDCYLSLTDIAQFCLLDDLFPFQPGMGREIPLYNMT